MASGVRGLCNGLGPAVFGLIFYLFNVNLNYSSLTTSTGTKSSTNITSIIHGKSSIDSSMFSRDIPGPPFLFGAMLAMFALMFSLLLPNSKFENNNREEEKSIEMRIHLLNENDEYSNELLDKE